VAVIIPSSRFTFAYRPFRKPLARHRQVKLPACTAPSERGFVCLMSKAGHNNNSTTWRRRLRSCCGRSDLTTCRQWQQPLSRSSTWRRRQVATSFPRSSPLFFSRIHPGRCINHIEGSTSKIGKPLPTRGGSSPSSTRTTLHLSTAPAPQSQKSQYETT
jgi:hypothetical protein